MHKLARTLLKKPPKNGRFYTVAIDGRGGSGKTDLASYVKELLPDFVIMNGDDYFEPATDHIAWGYFNDERFISDVIKPLNVSNSFTYRPYDWHAEPHITEKQMKIEKGLVLERCYSFMFDLNWDLKIWVETPKDVCLERGMARGHMSKEKEQIAWQIWQKEEDDYIEKRQPEIEADMVIDGTNPFAEQLQ